MMRPRCIGDDAAGFLFSYPLTMYLVNKTNATVMADREAQMIPMVTLGTDGKTAVCGMCGTPVKVGCDCEWTGNHSAQADQMYAQASAKPEQQK